jgi:hypothetical protein
MSIYPIFLKPKTKQSQIFRYPFKSICFVFYICTLTYLEPIVFQFPAYASNKEVKPADNLNSKSELKAIPIDQAKIDQDDLISPQANQAEDNQSPKQFFKLGVQHSQKLNPVDGSFMPGLPYKQDENKAIPSNEWFWIPSWSAGVWRSHYQTLYYHYDYASGVNDRQVKRFLAQSDEPLGTLYDRNKEVWEINQAPFSAVVHGSKYITVQSIDTKEVVYTGQDRIVFRICGKSLEVDPTNGKIVGTQQTEAIQAYTYLGWQNGLEIMRCDASLKHFDENGKAESVDKQFGFCYRIQDFEPIYEYKGNDTRALFRNYLVKAGLLDLLP